MSNTVIIIPARKGSTRFPNKPLAQISGRSVLQRTWLIAQAVQSVTEVYVATDDVEIQRAAEKFGANVILTEGEFQNGTERTFAAIQKLAEKPDIVLNLQGDAVLTPPAVIGAVVELLQKDPSVEIATPATHLNWKRYDEFVASKTAGRASGTLVVFDKKLNALYFSKGMIPFVRERKEEESPPIHRHIGLYGFRYPSLRKYVSLPVSPLEQIEGLEQLRALENSIPIRIVPVDYLGRTHWSIDNPEDIAIAEAIISREGELI